MGDITYKTSYAGSNYMEEAVEESARIANLSSRSESMPDLMEDEHSCFKDIDVSLVIPWSNCLDWWYRCNRCGKILFVYNCSDKNNDAMLKFLMDKAGFEYKEQDFIEYIEKFLNKFCK